MQNGEIIFWQHVMFVYSDRGALSAHREEAIISPLLSCGASKWFPFTQSNPWNALPGKIAYFLHLTENTASLLFSPYSGGSSGTAASAMLCVWHPFFQADLICLCPVCSLEQLGLHVTTLPIHHCIIAFMCLAPQMGISILHSSIVLCLCIYLSHCVLI